MITEVKLAEVIDVDSFNSKETGDLYTISVRTISDRIDRVYTNVRPVSNNVIHIPIIGEHVIIIKGLRQESTLTNRKYDWYYLSTYSIQSGINNNLLPGVTTKSIKTTEGFTDKSIPALQPYIGDYIMQGRWGNTIRLSSSVPQSSLYRVQPTWTDKNNTTTNPIIIISNNRQSDSKLVSESVDSAYSGIWLTSTQNIPFKLFTSPKKSKRFESQLIGFADRIVLVAKQDSIILDSKSAIELNSPVISTGTKTQKEGILHSTVIIQILTELIAILTAGTAKGDSLLLASRLSTLLQKLNTAENTNFLQDKN